MIIARFSVGIEAQAQTGINADEFWVWVWKSISCTEWVVFDLYYRNEYSVTRMLLDVRISSHIVHFALIIMQIIASYNTSYTEWASLYTIESDSDLRPIKITAYQILASKIQQAMPPTLYLPTI